VWIWLNWKVGWEVTLTLDAMLCKKFPKVETIGDHHNLRKSQFLVYWFSFLWSFIICKLWTWCVALHVLMIFGIDLCFFVFILVVCYVVFRCCALWNFKQSYIGGGAMNARVQKGELKFLLIFIVFRVGQWV